MECIKYETGIIFKSKHFDMSNRQLQITLKALSGLDILDKFYATAYKGDNFGDFLFALLHTKPLLKRVYLKEFAPKGNKFFSFTVDSFSEGRQYNSDSVASPESLFIPSKPHTQPHLKHSHFK